MSMYTRSFRIPKQSFFLLGPRGVGKSTLLRNELPDAHWVDLLDGRRVLRYFRDPGVFFDELNSLRSGSWVVVDEIQRVPELLNEVHRLIESKRLRFALTGSSARKLRSKGINLLGGRALRRLLYPLTSWEMGADFLLDSAISVGTLPLVVSSEMPEDQLEAYVTLYFREEIQAEALARNLPAFSRFLSVAALFHGQVLNISNVASEAEIKRPTVQGFMGILEDTLIARKLEAFESKLRVRERKHPKLYFVDPGLVRALKNERGRVSEAEKGPLLEGLVYMHLLAAAEYYRVFEKISYWAPAEANKTEVDFVISCGKELLAVEVKATSRLRAEHFKGLKAIGELNGVKRRILLYLGSEKRHLDDGIEVWPVVDFLNALTRL